MSAPWEDYAAPSTAPAAQAARTAPAAQTGAPWEAYAETPASAPQIPGPPDAASDPYLGLAPATDGPSLVKNLRTLTAGKVPADIIRSYVAQSGGALPPETETWLDDVYAKQPYETDFTPRDRSEVGAGDAAWSGLKSGALMGFDDEYQALWGAGGNKIGQWLGMNATTAPLADVYQQILQKNREAKDVAFSDSPIAYGAGYVPGALLSGFVTRGRSPAAPSLWGRLGQSAAEGARQGAISGAGNADGGFADRALGAVTGGAIGAPLGALAYPLGALVNNLAGRAYRAATSRGNPMSGIDELGARAPQDPAEMRRIAAEMEAAGVPPRPVDVVDESGRGVIRHAASEMTPGRQAVAQDSRQVAEEVQNRVRAAANEHISANPNTARQIAEDITGPEGMPGAGSRGDNMEAAIGPVRGEPVAITDEIKSILGTREGQAALRGAEGLMTDPADRAAARQVLAAAKAKRVDAEDLFRKEVKGWDDLPGQVKDAYRAQRPELVSPDPWEGVTLSVDTADKFARAMQGRAKTTPGLERVARAFGDAIRGDARAANPVYDNALKNYAAESGVADAALGTGKFRGSSFMDDSADQFGSRVARATSEPAAARLPNPDAPSVFRGGRPYDEVNHPGGVYTTPDRAAAQDYADMWEFGEADKGSQNVEKLYGALKKAADEDAVAAAAERAGVDPYDQDVVDVFDPEFADPAQIQKIVADLKSQGYDGARMPGQGFGAEDVDTHVFFNKSDLSRKAPLGEPTLSELDALRARARDEVSQRAGDNAGRGARQVARQLSQGAEQQSKNALLLGPEKAAGLQRRMAAEETRAANSEFINPNAGSKTNVSGRDAMVDGFADAVGLIASAGSRWGPIHAAARWLKQGGIRNVDAERLARDAISDDPTRLNAAIDYLESKGLARARASRFVSVLAAGLAGRAGGAAVDDGARAPPSARSLYVTPMKQGVEK